MKEPCVRAVIIYSFFDFNNAGNVVMRRSCTDIIVFIQTVPIIWFIKKQNTVQAAAFVRKLVSSRICKDLIVELGYKLQMFGVRLEGPAYFFCDNRGFVKNMSIPESVPHKKHNTMSYHSVHEAVAANILQIGK